MGQDEQFERREPAATQPIAAVQQAALAAAAATSTGNWIVGNNPQPVSCNVASAYTMNNGQLLHNGQAIGKFQGDTTVAFGAALTGNANPIINVGFSFINGIPRLATSRCWIGSVVCMWRRRLCGIQPTQSWKHRGSLWKLLFGSAGRLSNCVPVPLHLT